MRYKATEPTAPRAHLTLFLGAIGAGAGIAVLLLVPFPNLLGSWLHLTLATLTPLLGATVVGLLISGAGKRLPGHAQHVVVGAFVLVLALVLVMDAVVYVGPLLVRGATAHDIAPAFNTPSAQSTQVVTPATTPTLSGQFDHKASPVHSVAGTAVLGATSDGKFVLHLENLDSTNGPDLYVYASRVASPSSREQVMNGIEVARLKATQGDSNYELPAGIDLTQFKSVVIYCKAFSAVFGYANLT